MTTVGEIIEKLMAHPLDTPVYFAGYRYNGDGDEYHEPALLLATSKTGGTLVICPATDSSIVDATAYETLVE